jgi:hypothetical protein
MTIQTGSWVEAKSASRIHANSSSAMVSTAALGHAYGKRADSRKAEVLNRVDHA